MLGEPACVNFGGDRDQPRLRWRAGHRAIGVEYDPANERGNYVPTVMGERYDALLWFERTKALRALHHEPEPEEAEYETEPTGF